MARRTLALALASVLTVPLAVGAPAVAATPTGTLSTGGTTTLEGEVQRVAVDLRDGGSYTMTVVVPEEGDAVRVDDAALEDVPTGALAEVDVVRSSIDTTTVADPAAGATVTDVTVVDQASSASSVRRAPVARAFADGSLRDVHVVKARFPGTTTDSWTATQIASEVTGRVDQHWDDSTAGKVRFEVLTRKNASTTAPAVSSSCTDAEILRVLAFAGNQAGGVRPNEGKHALLYAKLLPACPFGGVAHVADGGSLWINGTPPAGRWMTVAHELGHNLTLGHSSSRNCERTADGSGSACFDGAYGDAYDVMGFGSGTGPLGGPHLDTMGLLDGANSVSASGTGTVTLAPVGGLSGRRFVKLDAANSTYYVEYRGAVGEDAGLGSDRYGCPFGAFDCESPDVYEPGVIVRRVEHLGVGAESLLLDAGYGPEWVPGDKWFVLPVGRTFTTQDRTWSITPQSVGSSATVSITAGTVPRPTITAVSGTKVGTAYYTKSTSTTVKWSQATVGSISGFQVLVDGVVRTTLPANARSASVALAAGQNRITVRTVNAGSGDRTATVLVVSDTQAPVFSSAPALGLRAGTVTGSTAIPVTLRWKATDNNAVHQVTQTSPTSRKATFSGSTTARSTTIGTGPVAWKLAARDRAGNTTTAGTYRSTSLVSDTAGARAGTWSRVSGSSYLAGAAYRATRSGASITFTTSSARSIAWIASKGADYGKVTVYVDGVSKGTVDLQASTTRHKQAAFVVNGLDGASHTVKVVVQGTAGRPAVVHDGFVVLK